MRVQTQTNLTQKRTMTTFHQTLKFGDLPIGTKFLHPKTNAVYKKTSETEYSNALSEGWHTVPTRILFHQNTVVTLTTSLDFFSIDLYAKFAYDNKVWIKIARNRAKLKNIDSVKYFEPDDSVSPL